MRPSPVQPYVGRCVDSRRSAAEASRHHFYSSFFIPQSALDVLSFLLSSASWLSFSLLSTASAVMIVLFLSPTNEGSGSALDSSANVGPSFITGAEASVFMLGLGPIKLLSSDTCFTKPTTSACSGGIAALTAAARKFMSDGTATVAVCMPEILSTAFVQMHPRGLAVNLDVYRQVGIRNFVALPSFYSQKADFSVFYQTRDILPVTSNLLFGSDAMWRHVVQDYVVEVVNGTRVAVTRVYQANQALSSDVVGALRAAIQHMRTDADIVVVICGDSSYTYEKLLPLLGGHLPDVFLDAGGQNDSRDGAKYTPVSMVGADGATNQTIYVSYMAATTGNGIFMSLQIDDGARALTGASVRNIALSNVNKLGLRDAKFLADQAFLTKLNNEANANDPRLTNITEAMSKSRTGGYFPCFDGECAQGTLYAKAYAWRYGVNIGFTNSGNPRGPGIPVGEVRTSDIWGFAPFINYACVGRLTGLKVWELVNFSMAYHMFTTERVDDGDLFMQTFGLQIDYDHSEFAVEAGTRVRAIRVRDVDSGEYLPLDRFRYYTFATDVYQCRDMAGIRDLFMPDNLYAGEAVDATSYREDIQQTIADYLLTRQPYYTPVMENYLTEVNVTAEEVEAAGGNVSSVLQNWRQTLASCDGLQRWDEGLRSCVDCPAGEYRSPENAGQCIMIPPPTTAPSDDTNLAVIIAPTVASVCAVLAILAGLLVFFLCFYGQNVRDTRFAPKGPNAAIVFTDIQMSTKLWGTVPASMGAALDQHHSLIRKAIAEHRGYEVKTVGDSFMIAFDSAQSAVDLAQQIQLDFMRAAWPRALNTVYAAESYGADGADRAVLLDMIDDAPEDVSAEGIDAADVAMLMGEGGPEKDDFAASGAELSFNDNAADGFAVANDNKRNNNNNNKPTASTNPTSTTATTINTNNTNTNPTNTNNNGRPAPHISKLFNGLRVRIGVHYGPVDAVFDEVAKGYDYYGNTVNVAARIESSGDGGQIVVSRSVANAIRMDDALFRMELLGTAELRGVAGAVELLQLMPLTLVDRVFTAKAVERLQAMEEDDEDVAAMMGRSKNTNNNKNDSATDATPRDETGSTSTGVASGGSRYSVARSSKRNNGGANHHRVLHNQHQHGSPYCFVTDSGRELTERDLAVRDIVARVFKPMKGESRLKHVAAVAKAWHVRTSAAVVLPPTVAAAGNAAGASHSHSTSTTASKAQQQPAALTAADKAELTLSTVAMRISAVCGGGGGGGGALSSSSYAPATNTAINTQQRPNAPLLSHSPSATQLSGHSRTASVVIHGSSAAAAAAFLLSSTNDQGSMGNSQNYHQQQQRMADSGVVTTTTGGGGAVSNNGVVTILSSPPQTNPDVLSDGANAGSVNRRSHYHSNAASQQQLGISVRTVGGFSVDGEGGGGAAVPSPMPPIHHPFSVLPHDGASPKRREGEGEGGCNVDNTSFNPLLAASPPPVGGD